jgi:hypothetical protein
LLASSPSLPSSFFIPSFYLHRPCPVPSTVPLPALSPTSTLSAPPVSSLQNRVQFRCRGIARFTSRRPVLHPTPPTECQWSASLTLPPPIPLPLPAPVLSFLCQTPAAGAEVGECSRHSTNHRRLRRGRGGQGWPHHYRRGVHGTQQELHQGSAGAPRTHIPRSINAHTQQSSPFFLKEKTVSAPSHQGSGWIYAS